MKDQITVTLPSAQSAEGYGYNKIYKGGEFYEFHSWPYNELPPSPTEVPVADYEFAGEAEGEDGSKLIIFKRKEAKDGNTTSKP